MNRLLITFRQAGWLLLWLFLLTACQLPHAGKQSYFSDANLELWADSVDLACLPVKDCYYRLYQGDRVVVAEWAFHPDDAVDSVWVKLAHSQEVQGWMRESDMKQVFVPVDSVSEFIYVFSRTHISYFLAVLSLFVLVWLFRVLTRQPFRWVCFHDIDSIYPLLLCLLMAFSATLYESMQVFTPEIWEHFYYHATLSPFQVPWILSLFLSSLWLFMVVFLATLDDLFRQFPFGTAFFCLLGLVSVCIFCYFFFIYTTRFYVGYFFLAGFACIFLHRLCVTLQASRYRCGACGQKMRTKGICPHCGAFNQ